MGGPSSGPRAKHATNHHPCQIEMQLGRSDWGFRLSREKLYRGSLWSNTRVTVQERHIDCFLDLRCKNSLQHIWRESSRVADIAAKIEVCPPAA